MSLRTAASIFKCFINLFVNYISSPPKYTRARSAGPSLEEQSCRSPSPSWLIVVAGVWNMADNASDGRVHVSRSTVRGKSDKSMFGGGNGDCCGYLSSTASMHSALCWHISVIVCFMKNVPLTGEVTESWGLLEKKVLGGSGLYWTDPYPASGQLWLR